MLLFDLAITGKIILLSLLGLFLLIFVLIQGIKLLGRKRAKSITKSTCHTKGNNAALRGRNKYPEVDFFKFRGVFIRFGFVIALGISFLLFGWTQYTPKVNDIIHVIPPIDDPDFTMTIPPTIQTPPPPPAMEAVPDDVVIKDPIKFTSNDIDDRTEVKQDTTYHKKPTAPKKKKIKRKKIDEIFKVVEQMPRFPGCEDHTGTHAERKKCADKKLLQFIYKNIKYPAIARENGVEGQVVIQFVVNDDGSVTAVEVLKDIGAKCGDEAKRVVELMNKKGIRWTPGRRGARPVKVQFILPVTFKLN